MVFLSLGKVKSQATPNWAQAWDMDTSFIIRRHHGSSYQALAPRDRRLNGDEAARLIVACGGMYKDPRGWQLLMGLALEAAMRAGDLIGMQWDEVNMDQ